MCGIAGLVANNAQAFDPQLARTMASRLRHRGPDDEGLWADPDVGVALAQRRLAIVDLSASGHQPMSSPGQRFVITFNGEIYNHRDIRRALDAEADIPWRGHSDTEVLIAAIEHWGLRPTLDRLVGMFAFGVWDRAERTLSLARDRLGEKPLYYGRLGRAFAFASEIKALRALPWWQPEIDRGALALLLRHNYIPAPYSIYRDVFKLRPGHVLTLGPGGGAPRIEAFWRAREAAEAPAFAGTREEAAERTEALLRQSIAGQMAADVPVGAFLSGGIDSSTVTALMQSLESRPVRTFTIGFRHAAFNEADHARRLAAHIGSEHTELTVTERDAVDVIPELPRIYCEPFADSSQIPTYLVSRLARQHVTVALSGDGGDELFSGYPRYAAASRVGRMPTPLRRAVGALAALPPPGAYDYIGAALGPIAPARLRRRSGDRVRRAARAMAHSDADALYFHMRSHCDPADALPVSVEPPTMFTGIEALPHAPGSIERMMHIDMLSSLPDDILVKVDRAAMAVGLETRMPMLDHRLVEFAISLPLAVLRSDGTPKWPLRQVLARHVPPAMFERPKMGFGIPMASWLRGGLRDWAEGLIGERRLREDGFFRPDWVRNEWNRFITGKAGNQDLLWSILIFQSWHDIAVEEPHGIAA